jgi:hypothetical protein
MRTYKAFYRGKQVEITAERSIDAQEKAAKMFKARKQYDVTVILCDVPVDPASI